MKELFTVCFHGWVPQEGKNKLNARFVPLARRVHLKYNSSGGKMMFSENDRKHQCGISMMLGNVQRKQAGTVLLNKTG